MADISWDEKALAVWLTAVEEDLIPDLAREVSEVAHAIAPIRKRVSGVPVWAHHGHIGLPGRLKASVDYAVDRDSFGLYADIGSLWYGRFLDPPARQLHHVIPFLPSALYFVVQGRTYYL